MAFELRFLLSELADCCFTVHNITIKQLVLPSMVSTSSFHVTCGAASSGSLVTTTNQGELLVNRTSIDLAVWSQCAEYHGRVPFRRDIVEG